MRYPVVMPHLLIQNGPSGSRQITLNGEVFTIGRHPESSFVLDDVSVSTRHAEITAADNRFILRDLESANGTTVNGQQVSEVELVPGDLIHFGPIECAFQEDEALEAAAPKPTDEPVAVEEQNGQRRTSFGSKLASLGKAALSEAKRNAQLAALRAKIEKLKRVDLAKAHHALGKRCMELGLCAEHFVTEYAEINQLSQRIAEMRLGNKGSETETTSQKLKRTAENAVLRAEAEAANLSLWKAVAALGVSIASKNTPPAEVVEEISRIRVIEESIKGSEAEAAVIRSASPSVRRGRNGLLIGLVLLLTLVGTRIFFTTQRADPRTINSQAANKTIASALAKSLPRDYSSIPEKPTPGLDYQKVFTQFLEAFDYTEIQRIEKMPSALIGPLVSQMVKVRESDADFTRFDDRIGEITKDTIQWFDTVRPILGVYSALKEQQPQILIHTPTLVFVIIDVRRFKEARGARFFIASTRIKDGARIEAFLQ